MVSDSKASGVYVTVMLSVAVLPDESVASTAIVFVPSVRVIALLQLVVPVARIPFTVTDAMAVSSDAVPETVIVDVVIIVPSVGNVMVMIGGVESPLFSSHSAMSGYLSTLLPPGIEYGVSPMPSLLESIPG